MNSSPPQIILIPLRLGEASSFNREIFPLLRNQKRGSISSGDLYLDATLEEIRKVNKFGSDPKLLKELRESTKARYDQLTLQKLELERRPKTMNPVKRYTNYRAAQLFLAASKSLYEATKSRSEDILRRDNRKSLLSIPAEDVQPMEGDVPPNARVVAIAVKTDGDSTTQEILDAANTMASYSGSFGSDANSFLTDEYVSAAASLSSLVSSDTEEASDDTISALPPSSPTIINNYFYGSIYSPNSTVNAPTVQTGGSNNSGSVTHTITPPS